MAIFKVSKYLYALSLDETLSKLEEQGADLATINFIKNSDQTIKPLYVKYLKENLNANISELQNNVQPIKKTENPLSPKEQAVINSLDDFMKVISVKSTKWINTKFEDYLTPNTLFGNKFESYLNENINVEKISKILDKQNCRFEILTTKNNTAIITIPEYRIVQ